MNSNGVVQLSPRVRQRTRRAPSPNGRAPRVLPPRSPARWDVDILCFATQRAAYPEARAEARLHVVVVDSHPVSVAIRRPQQDWDLILLPKEPNQRALLLEILAAIFGVPA